MLFVKPPPLLTNIMSLKRSDKNTNGNGAAAAVHHAASATKPGRASLTKRAAKREDSGPAPAACACAHPETSRAFLPSRDDAAAAQPYVHANRGVAGPEPVPPPE